MGVLTNFVGWGLDVKSERKVNFWREGSEFLEIAIINFTSKGVDP